MKDSNFTIDLEAPDNQGTEKPDFSNYTYTNFEPHLSANYSLTPNWSRMQPPRGDRVPDRDGRGERAERPEGTLAAGGASYSPGNLKEEQTTNYQLGDRSQDGQVQRRRRRVPD